jgi:hypothetical protein
MRSQPHRPSCAGMRPSRTPVLVIDGEMPAGTLQERLSRIAQRYGIDPPSPEYLSIVASAVAAPQGTEEGRVLTH